MRQALEISNGTTQGKTTLLRVSGRLDSKNATELVQRCSAVRSGGQNLVLNLSGVSFIASSGIGALLAMTEQFRESGRTVRFAALSEAVDSVIKLLNLDQFLAIDLTETDAMSALER